MWLLALVLLLLPATAHASDNSNFLRIGSVTAPPYGFQGLCEREPHECVVRNVRNYTGGRVENSAQVMAELNTLSWEVNHQFIPETDLEIYEKPEYWTAQPNLRGKADCEDFALYKRKVLINRGWPSSALVITVVRDEKGEGHAILTARLSDGDYILDNMFDDVRLWHRVPYQYHKRQSYMNPTTWHDLIDPRITTSSTR